jgi:putative hemolysin
MGYSLNATIAAPDATATIQALEARIKALQAAAKKSRSDFIANSADSYCHTHGYTKGAHNSATCRNKGPGHNDFAVIGDIMGGSTKRWQPRA